MAPRWSSNGSSGAVSLSYTTVALIALATLIAGAIGGYLVAGSTGNTTEARAARSAIAVSSIDGMETAEPNEAGAVKAATSFVVGLPVLAVQPNLTRETTIAKIVSPDADPVVGRTLSSTLLSIRTTLFGSATTTESRVVVSPAAYKSLNNAPDGSRDDVTVTVWYSMVYADPATENFRSAWFTTVVRLVQSDKGWQIQTLSTENGPTPTLYSNETTASPFSRVQPLLSNSYAYRYALAP